MTRHCLLNTWGPHSVDYAALVRSAGDRTIEEIIAFLKEELPFACRDAYHASTARPTEIVGFQLGSFEYVFDDYESLEAREGLPYSRHDEARLVVACGRS